MMKYLFSLILETKELFCIWFRQEYLVHWEYVYFWFLASTLYYRMPIPYLTCAGVSF